MKRASLPPALRPSRAFTLIELLTVIAIIGILAAIIIPTVGKVRDTAKTAQCTSNIRQVVLALRLFAESNKGRLPQASTPDWAATLAPFLPNPSLGRHPIHLCPTADYGVLTRPIAFSYAMAGGATGLNSFLNDNDGSKERSLNSIQNMSQSPWVIDSGVQNTTFATAYTTVGHAPLLAAAAEATPQAANTRLAFRHGGGNRANFGFGDGSVKSLSRSDVLTTFAVKADYIAFRR